MTQSFKVEMTMTRLVTVVVEANSETEARAKANNLEYQFRVDGEVLRWNVMDVARSNPDKTKLCSINGR